MGYEKYILQEIFSTYRFKRYVNSGKNTLCLDAVVIVGRALIEKFTWMKKICTCRVSLMPQANGVT